MNELHELMAAWLGEEVNDERRTELLDRLRRDDALRTAFVNEARTFAMLQAVQTAEPRWLSLQDELNIADAPTDSFENRVQLAIEQSQKTTEKRSWTRIVLLAACLLMLVGSAFLFRSLVAPNTIATSVSTLDQLAVVMAIENVVWRQSQEKLELGDSVTASSLSFSSGTLTLAFLNGVGLHIQGPATIQLASLDRIVCRQGNVRAKIGPGAEGFTIETPGAAVIDLGTELGVRVDQNGLSQVVVYEGKAEATLFGADGSPQRTQTLEAKQSVELDPYEGTMRSLEMYELLSGPKLFIADLKLSADYQQHVLAAQPKHYWPRFQKQDNQILVDVRRGLNLNIVGSASTMNDGSLSFSASSDLQFLRTDGVWTPPKEFAIELWFASEAFHNSTLAVLEAAPPHRGDLALIELTQRNRETPFKPGRIRFLYRWPTGGADGVNLYSAPLYTPFQWHHLVCQRSSDLLEMFLDGEQVGETRLTGVEESTDVILRFGRLNEAGPAKNVRQFNGRMAEIAIYERLLSKDEIRIHSNARR